MTPRPAFLAFDLGATSWRAILGRREPSGIAVEEQHRARHAPREVSGGLHWAFDSILDGIKDVLRAIAARGIPLASIGVDSWSVDYGLLDETGALLEPPRCYRDPRNQGMVARMADRITPKELFQRTGLIVEDITTLYQLLAASEATPRLLARARRLLFIPDLIRYALCGEQATDFTLASTSQMFDIHARRWDGDLLARLGIPERILPPVRFGHAVLGLLSPAVQAETGLGPVPVTTGASHDTAAAFLTQPSEADTAILSSGTWSMLGVHLPAPIFPSSIDPARFGHEGNPDGTVRLLCNIPGLWILEQCRESWTRKGRSFSYEELVDGASACGSFGGAIDPHDPSFALSPDMAEAVAAHCARAGQPVPETAFEVARAIFQGLARSYARALQELACLTGRRFSRLRVIGGGVRNNLLNSLIERAMGIEVVRGEAEATAVGNILSQERALAAARTEKRS